jgi:hypothetical protein
VYTQYVDLTRFQRNAIGSRRPASLLMSVVVYGTYYTLISCTAYITAKP